MIRKPKMHELKIQSEEYDRIISGIKNYIITKNNIDYMIGDMICFYDIKYNKETCLKITSISKNCVGIVDGYFYDKWDSGDCCLYGYWKKIK